MPCYRRPFRIISLSFWGMRRYDCANRNIATPASSSNPPIRANFSLGFPVFQRAGPKTEATADTAKTQTPRITDGLSKFRVMASGVLRLGGRCFVTRSCGRVSKDDNGSQDLRKSHDFHYLRPFRIISLSFWRIASMSGSAKAVSSVLTLFVFALVPLMALSS